MLHDMLERHAARGALIRRRCCAMLPLPLLLRRHDTPLLPLFDYAIFAATLYAIHMMMLFMLMMRYAIRYDADVITIRGNKYGMYVVAGSQLPLMPLSLMFR